MAEIAGSVSPAIGLDNIADAREVIRGRLRSERLLRVTPDSSAGREQATLQKPAPAAVKDRKKTEIMTRKSETERKHNFKITSRIGTRGWSSSTAEGHAT